MRVPGPLGLVVARLETETLEPQNGKVSQSGNFHIRIRS